MVAAASVCLKLPANTKVDTKTAGTMVHNLSTVLEHNRAKREHYLSYRPISYFIHKHGLNSWRFICKNFCNGLVSQPPYIVLKRVSDKCAVLAVVLAEH